MEETNRRQDELHDAERVLHGREQVDGVDDPAETVWYETESKNLEDARAGEGDEQQSHAGE